MNKIIILLLALNIYAIPKHFESRFIGIISEIKVINVDDQNDILIWLKIDKEYSQGYFVKSGSINPKIFIGDSLYEYWADYRKIGVGIPNRTIIYEIVDPNNHFYK